MLFIQLYLKECKQAIWNLTYLIILICAVLFFLTQMEEPVKMSEPDRAYVGGKFTLTDEEDMIMQYGVSRLANSLLNDNFTIYPIGFAKKVRLSEHEMSEMQALFCELIGRPVEDYQTYMQEIQNQLVQNQQLYINESWTDMIEISQDLSYERFKEIMERADKILGGGSAFASSKLKEVSRPMTYEEELENYHNFLYQDKISGSSARMFSDYMGILMGILPIFLVVTRCLRDKRSQIAQVIYSKQTSTAVILISRFLALVTAMVIPLLIMGMVLQMECAYYAHGISAEVDWLAFPKYIFGWILPEIMLCTALGIFVTEWTESPLAILIQGAWWFYSVFTNESGKLMGSYGLNLIPRFNSFDNYGIFAREFPQLVYNRLFYVALSLILLVAALYVYKQKRRGKIHAKRRLRKTSAAGA